MSLAVWGIVRNLHVKGKEKGTRNVLYYTECLKKEVETFGRNFHIHGWLKVSSII